MTQEIGRINMIGMPWMQIVQPKTAAAIAYLLRGWDATVANQSYTDAQVLDTIAELGDEFVGDFTVIEKDGALSVVDGKMVFTAQSTATWGDLGVYSAAITRSLGQTVMLTVDHGEVNTAIRALTLQRNQDLQHTTEDYVLGGGATTASIYAEEPSSSRVVGTYSSTEYQYAIVLGGYDVNEVPWRTGETAGDYLYGVGYFVKGGAYTNWTLLYRATEGNTSTLYGGFSNFNATGTLADFRIPNSDLSAVLDPTDYDATPGAGTAFTQTADCWLAFEADTLPAADQIEVEFRQQTANVDCWRITIDSGGTIDVDEVVSSAATQRITSAAAVSAGKIVALVMEDDDLKLYVGGVVKGTYASATNFKTETAGEVETLGTGGVVKELYNNPRTSATYDTEFDSV